MTKSAKVCICLSNVLVVYLFNSEFFCFIMSESIRNGSKVRPVQLPFIPLATLEVPKLHLTPEVHFAIPMCSAPHQSFPLRLLRLLQLSSKRVLDYTPAASMERISIGLLFLVGELAKRARHSQVCTIENRGYIYYGTCNFSL